MIKFEKTEVVGWEAAIRGMRNPMNSWKKSDSVFVDEEGDIYNIIGDMWPSYNKRGSFGIGPNDLDLMKRLRNAGTDHRKFMRMIVVYVDITAPLYWWKEFDTYKVGTVANSCSTMHKIHDKEFTLDDFSHEHLATQSIIFLENVINSLNQTRDAFVRHQSKAWWWQMIQLLPTSYNQKRTVMLSYEVLANIYKSRNVHKLDEWRIGFCEWIKSLPYSELIVGEED